MKRDEMVLKFLYAFGRVYSNDFSEVLESVRACAVFTFPRILPCPMM